MSMIVALGTDHAGLPLKERVVQTIRSCGHEVLDRGAYALDLDDDYPDFASAVADSVVRGDAERGVILCGSGVGASVAANKFRGIRAALCHDTFSARQGVEDDSMNVIALGARVVGPSLAREIVRAFLAARFSGAERHQRRLEKVLGFERGN